VGTAQSQLLDSLWNEHAYIISKILVNRRTLMIQKEIAADAEVVVSLADQNPVHIRIAEGKAAQFLKRGRKADH
jgi:hypothetical protein